MESFGDKGYLLKKSYFTAEECAEMTQMFESMMVSEKLVNYPQKILGFADIKNESIKQKVLDMIQSINQNYGLKVNAAPDLASFIFTDPSSSYGNGTKAFEAWHQDHDSHFLHGNHFNNLNIYVAVYKEDPADANLGVVPFDALRKKNLAAYVQALGGGATHWLEPHAPRVAMSGVKVDPETKMIVLDDSSGKATQYDFFMDDIETTHHLDAGDALIMRGDLIHCRQPFRTKRIALSFRVTSDCTAVSSSHFLNMCPKKSCLMLSNPKPYANMWAFMKAKSKDCMTWGEIKIWCGIMIPIPIDQLKLLQQAKFYFYRSLFYTFVHMRRYLMWS